MLLIKKYNKKLKKQWDLFVEKSFNGTLFQTQQFLSYHQKKKIQDHSLMFYSNQKIVAVFPAAEIKNRKEIHSHPGASYGGIVIDGHLSFNLIEEIIVQLIKYFKKKQFNKIILINSPHIYCANQNAILDYAIIWNNFNVSERYVSHATKLNQTPLKLLQTRKQRYIKQIIKNKLFSYKQSASYATFYKLLKKSKKKYNTVPTHTLKELLLLQKLFPQKIILLLFYKNKKIVGGALLFITNQKTGLVFYNTINEKYRKTQLAVFQLYSCMNFCINNKLQYIDFGVSHLPKGANPLAPKKTLIKFKEHFGAMGIIRTVYEKKLYD